MRMALRRHFDHTAPRISELDRVIMCGQSHTLCVLVWYDTCDRCFTLMMWTFRARRPFPRKRAPGLTQTNENTMNLSSLTQSIMMCSHRPRFPLGMISFILAAFFRLLGSVIY